MRALLEDQRLRDFFSREAEFLETRRSSLGPASAYQHYHEEGTGNLQRRERSGAGDVPS